MMARRRATVVTLLLGLLICVAIVLTSGIGHVELQPGRLHEGSDSGAGAPGGWSQGPTRSITLPAFDFFRFLFPVLLALLVISTAYSIRDRRIRSHLLFSVFALGAIVLAMVFLQGDRSREMEELAVEEEESETAGPAIPPSAPRDTLYVEPEGPLAGSRWPIIVTATLASILVALTASPLVLLFLRCRRRKHILDDGADEILGIAADAAREIRDGADVIGVVQRCYARMLRALSDRSGVNPRFRTPREFAAAMREVGLHSESVDALTEMFELVRYGGRSEEPFAAKAHGCLASLRLRHETS